MCDSFKLVRPTTNSGGTMLGAATCGKSHGIGGVGEVSRWDINVVMHITGPMPQR